MRTSEREWKALQALAGCGEDFAYLGFAHLAQKSGLERHQVRRTARALARKGLAAFGRGLWTDEGEMAGSGYCATAAGRDLVAAEQARTLADATPKSTSP